MKNNSSNRLSFLYSLLILFFMLLLLFVCSEVVDKTQKTWGVIVIAMSCFLVSFFVLRYFVFSFVYDRIKLIYKTINKRKTSKYSHSIKFDYNSDLVNQVQDDVNRWVEERELEIERMIEMNKYRKEFVGNVSHELKSPIFNVQGYTLSLLEGGLEDETINKRYLKKIEKNINRMINIVNDLDSISKLESGQLELRLESLELVEICEDVLDSLEDVYNAKNISVEIIKHFEKKIFIKADKEYLNQIIINLLINAIHYNDEKGNIKIELFEMDTNVLIEVTDDGIGISEEDLPRVFERFYRADKSRSLNSGGSGLGLAIVKHIIEAHGQTVNVRSTLGVGTTVAFTMAKV